MPIRSLSLISCAAILLAAGCLQTAPVGISPVAEAAQTSQTAAGAWVASMQCGGSTFRLQSDCTASGSDMELNICRSQSLAVTRPPKHVQVKLPNPLPEDRVDLLNAGSLEQLFVVQWGCQTVQNRGYAVLHYSTGGGNAPGSENVEYYDATGSQVDKSRTDWKDLNEHWDDSLKPVKSLMPLEGAE